MLQFFKKDATPEIQQILHVFFNHFTTTKSQNCEIFVDAYKKILGYYINWVSAAETHDLDNAQISDENFKRIFHFGMYISAPYYLQRNAKFETEHNFNMDIYHYIVFATHLNLQA